MIATTTTNNNNNNNDIVIISICINSLPLGASSTSGSSGRDEWGQH